MPRIAIDYSRTVIYKFVCKDLNIKDVYVGHTTNFTKRKTQHKNKCNDENNRSYNVKVYRRIRENGGWNNWEMIEIEKFPCQDQNEAIARERHWYELNNSTLNTSKPNRTKAEYRTDNIEQMRLKDKTYRDANKDIIKTKHKIYYDANKEFILQQVKEHYIANKEQYLTNKKLYYEKKKEEIAEKRSEKFDCECGPCVRKFDYPRHLKSKKHLNFINSKN